ncbi:MAG: phosphosulfolactate synthase [Bacteroidia bacterium]|nr:phosphosulfolactate synthase [Bacteroidia bacterium]
MNFPLSHIPDRSSKPRETGFTMVMDKGLSVREAEDFLSVGAEFTDVVKLGWSTSVVTPNLQKKLDVYKAHNIPFYFGGTLFEAFYIRKQLDEFRRILDRYDAEFMEISDGSVEMETEEKCKLIEAFAGDRKVLSEVGSKKSGKIIPPYQWVNMMQSELQAGSWKVIAEARESGNVGMFRADGQVRSDLVEEILQDVPGDKILWEAPKKVQQVWFIKLLGANVNLGNIAPAEIIPLETIRLGLRGDTFHHFLGDISAS